MSNHLDLPDDLNSLIEKRDQKRDRRKTDSEGSPPDGMERRSGLERRTESDDESSDNAAE